MESAVYNKQRLTCVASLFFQHAAPQKLCKRKLLLNLQESTLIRHKDSWIYHFPTPRKLMIRCPGNEASPPHTQTLVDAGLLVNATACHISTEDLQVIPTLHGSMQTELITP